MHSRKETYSIRYFYAFLIGFEIVFWSVFFVLLFTVGYYKTQLNAHHFEFLNPTFAWLFLVIYTGLFYYIYTLNKHNQQLKKIPKHLLKYLLPSLSSRKMIVHYILIRNILVFVVLALMQPVFGVKKVTGTAQAKEVVFVVDISNSMNSRDLNNKTPRILAARRAMQQFVSQSNASKYGIIVFAGNAFPHLPITADRGAISTAIKQISTSLMTKQGTDIGQALLLASDFFSKEKTNKTIVLITDGEDHEGGVSEAIDKLKKQQIQLLLLGLGTAEGGLIPIHPERPDKGYIRENDNLVLTKLNQEMIQKLAKSANGKYVISESAFPNINRLLTQINTSKATEQVALELEVKESQYHLFATLGILLLCSYLIWQSLNYKKNARTH